MKKKVLIFGFLVFGLLGCASFDPAGPRSEREAFPLRNPDPRWGLIINEGTAHLNIVVLDGARRPVDILIYDERFGRFIEGASAPIYLAGANRILTINGQNIPRYKIATLPIDDYYIVEVWPFYYQTDLLGLLFGQPVRHRIDLPKQETSIYVGRNPSAYYDYGYYGIGGTYRHWGWILRLNGGYVPETAHGPGIPGLRINLQGNFR